MTQDRPTGRPSLQQAEKIDRIVLDTAMILYLREGQGVTMKAIIQASGLSSKTVYARYPYKDALYHAVLLSLLDTARPPMDLSRANGPPLETLRGFIHLALASSYRPEAVALHRMLTADPAFARQLGPDIFRTVDRAILIPLRDYFASLLASGDIRPVDPTQVARAITALILSEPASRSSLGQPPPDEGEIGQQADFIARLVCQGLAP